MKKLTLAFLFFTLSTFIFAKQYRISDVNYDIKAAGFSFLGKTNTYVLKNSVPVDTKKVFSSEEELYNYLNDYRQQLENLRAFAYIEIYCPPFGTFEDLQKLVNPDTEQEEIGLESNEIKEAIEALEDNENTELSDDKEKPENNSEIQFDLSKVNFPIEHAAISDIEIIEIPLQVNAKDSHHMLIVPYVFKIDSNSGWNPKIKAKDKNFLGSLNTMDSYFEAVVPFSGNDTDAEIGLGISFDLPFELGPFYTTWENDYSFDYNITEKSPEYSAKTGLSLTYPMDWISFSLGMYQYAIRNIDYVEDGDDIYFKELATFSTPITLAKIENWGGIYYSPYVQYAFTWDLDGLQGSDLTYSNLYWGHSISSSRINWDNKFRKGASFNLSNSYSWNTNSNSIGNSISFTIQAHYNWKIFPIDFFDQLGISTQIYGFLDFDSFSIGNGSYIGGRLRGVRDFSKFSEETGLTKYYRMKTPTAIVMNFDMPVHLFTLVFNNRFMSIFNCNVQASPFVDVALGYNYATKRMYSIKDGFYCAGLEVLVYPLKFSSYEVRASVGVDVGRLVLKNKIDTEWRMDGSKYEYSLGIGLHY